MRGVATVGLSHHTASVEVREQFALDQGGRFEVAARVLEMDRVEEALVLSTCNRTEVYVAGPAGSEEPMEVSPVRGLLLERGSVPAATLFRVFEGEDAVAHAFHVASGLDSLVLGGTQILGQIKQAFEEARAAGFVGPTFQRLFPATFSVAKKAHTRTAISSGNASIGSVAVELAAKVFEDLPDRTAFLLGAGRMGETIARSLVDRHVARIVIAGRGETRAKELAERLGSRAVAVPLSDAMARLHEADVVLTAASPEDGRYLLTPASLAHGARRTHDRLIVDVGLPRNVDPAVSDLPDLFLYDLDDLEAVSEETRRRRQKEVVKVEDMCRAGVRTFVDWWGASASISPLLRQLHGRFDEIRRRELERTLSRVPEEYRAVVERFSAKLVDKLLQTPTIRLKRSGQDGARHIEALRELFELEDREGDRDDDQES